MPVSRGAAASPRQGANRRCGDRAEVVDQPEVHDLWERSWRRDLAGTRDLDRVVAQLVEREHLNDRVVAVAA